VHRSLGLSRKTRWVRVLIGRLIWKRGAGGNRGEQLTEEVVPKLTDDLVENIRVLDIG
jgi:hypothetical protein